jgi:hypothetical protein
MITIIFALIVCCDAEVFLLFIGLLIHLCLLESVSWLVHFLLLFFHFSVFLYFCSWGSSGFVLACD